MRRKNALELWLIHKLGSFRHDLLLGIEVLAGWQQSANWTAGLSQHGSTKLDSLYFKFFKTLFLEELPDLLP